MVRIVFCFTALLVLVGCGAIRTSKVDGFDIQAHKKIGVVVANYVPVEGGNRKIENAVLEQAVNNAMEKALEKKVSILPGARVIPADKEILDRLMPGLEKAYPRKILFSGNPTKYAGSKELFTDLGDYFTEKDIDLLIVLSGSYVPEMGRSNLGETGGYAAGALLTGEILGASAGQLLGILFSKPHIPVCANFSVMGVDRSGQVTFVTWDIENHANMLNRADIELVSAKAMEKVKRKIF